VPEPGGVQVGDGDDGHAVLAFVADNQRKAISDLPALTCHASDRWSADHWQASDSEVAGAVAAAAAQWIGEAAIVATRVRRWRLATPQPPWPQPTWLDPERRVALAGDAFAGPRVEGAYLSGRAAAAALAEVN
jgi:renalase